LFYVKSTFLLAHLKIQIQSQEKMEFSICQKNTFLYYLIYLFETEVASSKPPAILAYLSKLDITISKREKYCLGKLIFISLPTAGAFSLSEKQLISPLSPVTRLFV